MSHPFFVGYTGIPRNGRMSKMKPFMVGESDGLLH